MDVALPAFMGETRAQLIRSQEFLQGQLAAEVCWRAVAPHCHMRCTAWKVG